MFNKHYWPRFNDLNKNGIFVNEEKNVCQCWILAKKYNILIIYIK